MAGLPLKTPRTGLPRPAAHRQKGAWLGLFASAMLAMALAVHPPHQAAMALEAAALAELSEHGDHASAPPHQAHSVPVHACPHQSDSHPVEARLESADGHDHDESHREDMRCPVCVQLAGTSALPGGADLVGTIHAASASVPAVQSSEHHRPRHWLQPPLRAPPLLS